MNRMDNSAMGFVQETGDSDSDTNSDEAFEYYQPISTVTAGDDDGVHSDQNSDDGEVSNHYSNFHPLPNGYASGNCMGNGFSSLDLSDEVEDEEEEEERTRETSESERAIERAFREDERRRQALLTPENASRVMEAMRGVSFGGLTPDWVGRIPEDQWIDQIRRLRQPPSTGTGTATATATSSSTVDS